MSKHPIVTIRAQIGGTFGLAFGPFFGTSFSKFQFTQKEKEKFRKANRTNEKLDGLDMP
jgi:hypothetical protein